MAMAAVTPNAAAPAGKEHRREITVPELKRWLKQFGTDHEGRISRKELRKAIRVLRGLPCFSGLLARADGNHNGFVYVSGIEGLIQFAERELGLRFTTDAAVLLLPCCGKLSGLSTTPPHYRAPTTYQKSNNSSVTPNAAAPAERGLLLPGKEQRASFTVEEYKLWLKQFHTDNEGRIDRKELREAISRRGACFSGLHAGAYGNLIQFTERELGFRITTGAAVRPGSRDAMGGYYGLRYGAPTYHKSNDSSDHMTW